jgi:hypothetical protein
VISAAAQTSLNTIQTSGRGFNGKPRDTGNSKLTHPNGFSRRIFMGQPVTSRENDIIRLDSNSLFPKKSKKEIDKMRRF